MILSEQRLGIDHGLRWRSGENSRTVAIDFITLPPGGVLVRAPVSRPANWNGFGAEVLAVADGTVVAALDDIPDDTPTPIPLENASGNYLMIDREARIIGQHVDRPSSSLPPRRCELAAGRRGPPVPLQPVYTPGRIRVDRCAR